MSVILHFIVYGNVRRIAGWIDDNCLYFEFERKLIVANARVYVKQIVKN